MEHNAILTQEFDRLCSEGKDNKVISDIHTFEAKHCTRVMTEYGRFVSQFDLYYESIVQLILCVNYINKSNWPKYRSVQFLLFVHNLKSLYSAFDRLIKGFYEDSSILARPVYEAFIKSVYITCDPSDPFAVVRGAKGAMKRKFNLTDFLKKDLQLEWHDYKLYSSWAHANQYSVLQDGVAIHSRENKDAICLKFQFDKRLFELGVNNINYLLLVYLKVIVALFATESNNILKKEMLKRAEELIDLRERAMTLHPKNYWPRVIKDTSNIFEMIKRVELGEPWKIAWETLRSFNK